MKTIKTIFNKEIRRIFTDVRMLCALFLPGIIIFLIYSVMGDFVNNSVVDTTIKNETYKIAYSSNYRSDNLTDPIIILAFGEYVKSDNEENNSNNEISTFKFDINELATYKESCKNNDYHLIIAFSDNFEDGVYSTNFNKQNTINFYYNGSSKISLQAYQIFSQIVSISYNNYLINYDLDTNTSVEPNLVEENYILKTMMAYIFPIITISLLFSTVISIAPEAMAGEKERGTLTSLLITPTKRSDIIIGKVFALTLTAILSGTMSFLGLILSLPKLMGSGGFSFDATILTGLFFIIVISVMLFVTIGLLISTFASTIKEASSYLSFVMIILMIFSVFPNLLNISELIYSFIPLFNIICSINLIINESITIPYLIITILSNLIMIAVLIFITSKLFNNEKIIYSKG